MFACGVVFDEWKGSGSSSSFWSQNENFVFPMTVVFHENVADWLKLSIVVDRVVETCKCPIILVF